MEQLDGKVAVITGAARGIGAALAARFAAEGMRLALADVDGAALDRVVARHEAAGTEVIGVVTDVSDAAAVEALAAATRDRVGTAHVVCNNAGVSGHVRPSWDQPDREWEWVLGVNLFGVIHGMRSFVPMLLAQDEGHVVNTASLAGLIAAAYVSPYTASKHAVVALSTSLFHELAMSGSQVGVSVLCPAFLQTEIMETDRAWPDRLGSPPGHAADPGSELIHGVFAHAIEEGGDPADLADRVVDGIRTRRFLVTTHQDQCTHAAEVTARVVEGAAPALPPI